MPQQPFGRDTRSFRERAHTRATQLLRDEAKRIRQMDDGERRPGPARKPVTERRTELLGTRVTLAEAEAIRTFASKLGGVSDWLRAIALVEIAKGS